MNALAAALGDSLAARMVVEVNPRARRLSLRVDPAQGRVVLVRPKGIGDRPVLAFVASRVDWISKHLEALPPRVHFADGATVPYKGADHIIRLRPEGRGGVWREAGQIIVTGRPEHAARRVRDWLKSEAKRALTPRVQAMATSLGVKATRVTVRDTRSRWGSCTPDGRLSFSWRLILAPEAVLTYVAAHEVAHLRHLNHGRAFWRTVSALLEEAQLDARLARQWLRRSGAALHAYG